MKSTDKKGPNKKEQPKGGKPPASGSGPIRPKSSGSCQKNPGTQTATKVSEMLRLIARFSPKELGQLSSRLATVVSKRTYASVAKPRPSKPILKEGVRKALLLPPRVRRCKARCQQWQKGVSMRVRVKSAWYQTFGLLAKTQEFHVPGGYVKLSRVDKLTFKGKQGKRITLTSHKSMAKLSSSLLSVKDRLRVSPPSEHKQTHTDGPVLEESQPKAAEANPLPAIGQELIHGWPKDAFRDCQKLLRTYSIKSSPVCNRPQCRSCASCMSQTGRFYCDVHRESGDKAVQVCQVTERRAEWSLMSY